MQLYSLKNIHFPYIIAFLDSLLKGLQEFPTFKQIVSLDIGLRCIICDSNQGHIISELYTQDILFDEYIPTFIVILFMNDNLVYYYYGVNIQSM